MIIESCVNGVSTRSVDDLVAAMGVEAGISKSEVARICAAVSTSASKRSGAERWAMSRFRTFDEVTDTLADRFPKAAESMRDAKTDVLAFTSFPRSHWRKIWSNNPLERLNKEVKRRSNVLGISPTTPPRSA